MPGRIAVLLVTTAMLGFAQRGAAQDSPEKQENISHPSYVAVIGGYSMPEESFATRGNGLNLAALWGKPFHRRWGIEVNLNGSIFETGAADETDFYQTALNVDLVWNMTPHRGEHFTPYVLVGAGMAKNDLFPDSRDDTNLIYGGGIGFVTGPLNHMGMRMRAEARYIHDTIDDGGGEPRVSIGLEFPLRHPHEAHAVAPVIETRTVERVVEVPRAWIDTDGDGVDDEHDRCPGTLAGLRADANGCVIGNQTIELAGVNFEFSQARLTQNAETILDQVSKALTAQAGMRFEIAGHTDTVGSKQANQSLSQKRAATVRAYLISKGVPPDSLTAAGYGESQLLVDPELTPDDAERNRRVELRVLSAEQTKETKP